MLNTLWQAAILAVLVGAAIALAPRRLNAATRHVIWWIALAAALYPKNWRQEYGDEFAALLDDTKPGWRVFANALGGAIAMQIAKGTSSLK